ncbi:hypothetical protein ACWD4G_26895 [Streptomyces sp. NPDC002643]
MKDTTAAKRPHGPRRARRRITPTRRLRLLLLLPLAAAASVAPVQAAPAALPGGKPNFVVATGKMHDVVGRKPYDNWVQLGWYRFDAAKGQVAAETFVWSQNGSAEQRKRETTTVEPDRSCSGGPGKVTPCEVLTAHGYFTRKSKPPVQRVGGYALRSEGGTEYVDIRWPRGHTETWSVHEMPGLARLEWEASNNSTAGYAYGSAAPISERRPMETVQKHASVPYVSTVWEKDEAREETQPGTFRPGLYTHCRSSTWCLTSFQAKSDNACRPETGCREDRKVTSIEYYLARINGGDRRDTLWHWCSCLTPRGTCYQGNSHIKPMLQIIDDNNRFRGYVGAEASFYPGNRDVHRRQDMLGVFRFAEPSLAGR